MAVERHSSQYNHYHYHEQYW